MYPPKPTPSRLHKCNDHETTLLALCGATPQATQLNYCGPKYQAVFLNKCTVTKNTNPAQR